jgi:murein DD-endopeptidase MepM/ murein hydrolase activator NlpD
MKNFNLKQFEKLKHLNFRAFLAKYVFSKVTATAALATSALIMTNDKDDLASNVWYNTEKPTLSALPVVNPTIKYGFALDTFNVIEDKIKSSDVFTTILTKRGLTYRQADSLSKKIKPAYDFDRIITGKPFTVLTKDPRMGYDYFVYEPDAKRYIIFDLKTPSVKEVKRDIEVKEFETSGKVHGSLWETLVDNGMSYQLTDMVEDALKYKFDLRKFEDGDEYKFIWEEEIVEGHSVGVKRLKAVSIKEHNEEKPVYAFYFDNGKEKGWYAKDGLPMRDGFLKSPVKYSQITSHYSKSRMHPILGYARPHFGTDYAAPHGTPILAVADGVVTESQYGAGGNGNYVKIRHMKPYESQYLHMSRFAKGIRPGTSVKQGEVIGYVGSTGLATGPHVCFRFWKKGVQVNHLHEKLPQVSTFSSEDRSKFKQLSDSMIARLNGIPIFAEADLLKQKKVLQSLRGKP